MREAVPSLPALAIGLRLGHNADLRRRRILELPGAVADRRLEHRGVSDFAVFAVRQMSEQPRLI
jgi:hypothetical protein